VGTIAPDKEAAPKGLPLQGRDRTESCLSLASEYAEPKDHDDAVSLRSSVILCVAPQDGGGLTVLNWRIVLKDKTAVHGVFGPHCRVPRGMYSL